MGGILGKFSENLINQRVALWFCVFVGMIMIEYVSEE